MDDIFLEIYEEINSVIGEAETSLKEMTARQRKETYKAELQEALKVVNLTDKEKKRLNIQINKIDLELQKQKLTELAAYGGTLKEREDAKSKIRLIETEEKIAEIREERLKKEKTDEEKEAEKELRRLENQKKLADKAYQSLTNGMDKLYTQMSSAATTYSGYVDKISTRLFGANETFSSISKTVSEAFGASPFFKMSTVFEQISTAVSKGISYNIEERASMNVLAEKVATTFDAFNDNLLRLIRVQQADSTRARLGMESLLNEFLNKNYQDTSYLNGMMDNVSANLFEASSVRDRQSATELEYVVQKYLGSFSSVGVSNSLIENLSRGIGYLASGDVSSLSSNDALQQLLVSSANRGGGTSYGEMLTGTFGVSDAISVFEGFRKLIQEISSTKQSNNIVAMNQYAKIFGMTVSDISASLNISNESMSKIAEDLKSYSQMLDRVGDETSFSKLYSRTGGASLGTNLYQNFIDGAGKGIGKTAAGYLSWELAGTLSGFLKGIETGIDFNPFGVGGHVNLSIGDIMKAATVSGGALAGITSMMQGLGSLKGVDILKLTEENRGASAEKGDWLSNLPQEGAVSEGTTLASYTGDFSEGALSKSAGLAGDRAVAQYTDNTYDEEKQKMEKTQEKLIGIADNVEFIVQLLNESGIVIRGGAGLVPKVNQHFTDTASTGSTTLGVLFG